MHITHYFCSRLVALIFGGLALLSQPVAAQVSEAWPTKPVRFVVPYVAGGASVDERYVREQHRNGCDFGAVGTDDDPGDCVSVCAVGDAAERERVVHPVHGALCV